MEFREMLAHLARFHQIDAEGMATFKARIHILRKAGIPQVRAVGKGARASFSLDHVTELHLALTMSEFGLSPARISQIMDYIRWIKPWWPFTQWDRHWLMITLRASNGKLNDLDSKEIIQGIGIVGEGMLLHDLKAFSKTVPTWHAVLSLQQVAENLRSVE